MGPRAGRLTSTFERFDLDMEAQMRRSWPVLIALSLVDLRLEKPRIERAIQRR
jgi:hypothetical protein